MQRFHTKIDWWVIAFVIAFSGLLSQLLLTMYARGTMFSYPLHSVVFLLAIVLVWWPIFNTRYVVQAERLIIRTMWFKWEIPLPDIQSIGSSQNSQFAPALSLSRLKIDYLKDGESKSILISPRRPQLFKQALQSKF